MALQRDEFDDDDDAAASRGADLPHAAALVGGSGIAAFAAFDIWGDLGHTSALHVMAEGAVFVTGAAAAVWAGLRLQRAWRSVQAERGAHEREVAELSAQLAATQAEAKRFRDEARDVLAGLSAALDKQFDRWGLTPAERETALLLLKGLSHKEIAEVRHVTEATARQQSRALYKKGGLSGRTDLAAFFLEDLLVPGGNAKRLPAVDDG
jgi:DNA-binding CsgD family transcriptional regulator